MTCLSEEQPNQPLTEALLPFLAMHLHTLPSHLPTSLPRLIPDDDMFISPPSRPQRSPPCRAPDVQLRSKRVKQSNWGRVCSKVHSPHQCKGCEEWIALSAHLHSRVSKVTAQNKKGHSTLWESWMDQGMRPGGDQDASHELRGPISCVARDA